MLTQSSQQVHGGGATLGSFSQVRGLSHRDADSLVQGYTSGEQRIRDNKSRISNPGSLVPEPKEVLKGHPACAGCTTGYNHWKGVLRYMAEHSKEEPGKTCYVN